MTKTHFFMVISFLLFIVFFSYGFVNISNYAVLENRLKDDKNIYIFNRVKQIDIEQEGDVIESVVYSTPKTLKIAKIDDIYGRNKQYFLKVTIIIESE